ncbi:MAG: wax ester/triacylglycerol synthase family O-acyltransferase [Nocardioidaceae bacterium]|nr:wax ester/triacylglycerol synthase family O-acyltransferase [Nocardioidaceae bacterium]
MQRLSPLDAMFLNQDSLTAPRQIASLAILSAGDHQLDYDRLVQVINDRIDIVPRYRQRAMPIPGRFGTPLWVDDEDFDISLHVRRSALPKPGSMASLRELVGRLIARRLDHDRPLWELYFVEGLKGGRVALLFKAHQALVDGSDTIDLAQVLLEETAHERDIPHQEWNPRSEPGSTGVFLGSMSESLRHPRSAAIVMAHNANRWAQKLPLVGRSTVQSGPLSAELGQHRRFATVMSDLDDYRRVRDVHGGTVNDVILATIAGGIRGWLLTRAEPVSAKWRFRAMVPMSVVAEDGLPTSLGSKVRGHMLSLPVGESNPVVRLHQVSYALKDHRETGSAVAANKLANLPGFATSTFHAVGARVADSNQSLPHQIVITNVPGPQEPVYMAGQQLEEVYPCLPLSEGRALSIGVTSYHGKVFFGIVADREAIPDADVLAQCIEEALTELVESIDGPRNRAPRGRLRPSRGDA